MSPPSTPGIKRVSVSIDQGRTFLSANLVFEYRPSLVIKSLVPSSATVNGGTLISIFGLNFVPDSLLCRFDGINVVIAHVLSSSLALCTAPRHSPGTISFELSHNSFEWERLAFSYEP